MLVGILLIVGVVEIVSVYRRNDLGVFVLAGDLRWKFYKLPGLSAES